MEQLRAKLFSWLQAVPKCLEISAFAKDCEALLEEAPQLSHLEVEHPM
jgi:hypothetical protein